MTVLARSCACSLAVALAVASCAGGGAARDASSDATERATDVVDVATDGHDVVHTPAQLFDPCVTAADCAPVRAARCVQNTVNVAGGGGDPEGECSRACTIDADCSDGTIRGLCIDFTSPGHGLCQPACAATTDCRDGYICFPYPTQRACAAFCTADAQCGGTAVCDRWLNLCYAPPHASRGGDDGAPCANMAGDCKAYCQFEMFDNGFVSLPTGYLGGQCFSQCMLPQEPSVFPLVQGDCPDGAVCVGQPSQHVGDLGQCLQSCRDATDCRPGYACYYDNGGYFSARDAGTLGWCGPINCHDGVHDCPAGYACIDDPGGSVVDSMPAGVCARASGDAGVDGG